MLRALDAATLALPAAAAARRDAERLCAARMTEAYHARGAFDGKDAAAGPDSGGVTLLEALAHTRSIRARVAALADLFGGDPLDARSSSSSSSSSGAALLRRTARRLAFAGAGERDGSVDWTLRRVAAAAAAPMLAQMRAWTSAARVRDPRAEFPVATSPDWGSSAATLEWAPAERTLRRFRRRTEERVEEGVSEDEDEGASDGEDDASDDGFERLRTASDSDASSALSLIHI